MVVFDENDFGDDEVFRFLPDGTPLAPIGAGALLSPGAVDFDSAGRLYVMNDLNIERFLRAYGSERVEL